MCLALKNIKMKKIHYSIPIAVAIIALVGVNIAGAQTTTTNESGLGKFIEQRQQNINDMKTKLENRKVKLASTTEKIKGKIMEREGRIASTTAKFEERKEKIASSTAARKVRLEERFKDGVSNKIAKVVDRLGDAINRIKDIDSRIVSRIAKLKAANVDTSKVDALLVDAQAKLKAASDNVLNLESGVGSVLTGGVSTSTKASIKTKITDVNASVKAAHAAYVKVIENIKTDQPTATTTAQ